MKNTNTNPITAFWFRRDLRLNDNRGLYEALRSGREVLPVFIFDRYILDKLENKSDARVEFIRTELNRIREELKKAGNDLLVCYGKVEEVWNQIIEDWNVKAVYCNRDYEPYAKERDSAVKKLLENSGIDFQTFKDHVITEGGEVLKDDGDPYVVFTPFKRKWFDLIRRDLGPSDPLYKSSFFKTYPSEAHKDRFLKWENTSNVPPLVEMGFSETDISIPSREVSRKVVREYSQKRDYPAMDATSRLGIHFRFGTLSIREKAAKASGLNETFLNELIWRDFYSQILFHFPHVVDGPFREKYAAIQWLNNETDFRKWCEGRTGFPLVDAGMRQLNTEGYMHNRIRMLTASFLTKHLLIDWRWGEAYFAKMLLDFDLASNSGGWQWAAGCGTDAAPYFRIFSPDAQLKKFDKHLEYVKKYVPEFGTSEYPDPIVDHKKARERCLRVYKETLDS
ncbi:MAG: deoxyribodipyrimidine photo-lyase [Saprospirales bacterium]|nr:MAG: deoxyribodipyrimidine photo-lyase [Saprospirales bacterium]